MNKAVEGHSVCERVTKMRAWEMIATWRYVDDHVEHAIIGGIYTGPVLEGDAEFMYPGSWKLVSKAMITRAMMDHQGQHPDDHHRCQSSTSVEDHRTPQPGL